MADALRWLAKLLERPASGEDYGVIIVAIKRASGDMVFNPVASVSLEENDTLIAMGKSAELEKLVKACQTA